MEGHRRYAEEPEPSWYTGSRSPDGQAANPYDTGVHERPSGAFRLPDQRPADPYATPASYAPVDPLTTTGNHALSPADSGVIRIPVRGPEYPTVRPAGATSLADAPAAPTVATTNAESPAYNEPTSVVPVAGDRIGTGPGRIGAAESVYSSRRPVSAVVFAVVTVVLLIPAVVLLVRATFVDNPTAGGVVPAVLLTLGLPLTGLGLYSLAGGRPVSRDTWLRPPVAYLPIGLILLLAAGLGAG